MYKAKDTYWQNSAKERSFYSLRYMHKDYEKREN